MSAQGRPSQFLQHAAQASHRKGIGNRRTVFLEAPRSAQQGARHRIRDTEPTGRMLRLRRHFFDFRGAGFRQDGLRQGCRSSRRWRRIHRLRGHVVPHAPKGLRRAGRSRHPLHPYRADPQWRSRMKRIDHAEAASEFIAAKAHQEFHDRRLWDLRLKRDREAHGIPEWEELRTLASQIKEHTLTHLAEYLEEFEARAKENGAHVHWARETTENNQIVYEILSTRGAKTLVKSKSMLTEECDMRPFLERREIEVIETDLGERIQQLDDEPPSHIVVPAVHKLRGDVSAVFARTIGAESGNDDIHYLAETQRRTTRPYFLRAEAGMTGANFAVAETGSFVVCTNEGNADLSANVPKLHIASIGIEKIIPSTARWRRASHRARRQWTLRAPRHARFLVFAEMHPVRSVHEYLPGLSPKRGAELWRDLLGSDRRHHRSHFQYPQIQQPPVRFHPQRQLHQCLPCQDQHSRADLQMAADHCRTQPASVREKRNDAHRRQGAGRPETVSRGHLGGWPCGRASPALRHLQLA